MTSLLQSALWYAKRGFFIFPLTSGTKVPATEHGFKDATRDAEIIEAWWERWPRANIGIATGRSDLVVVDIDVKQGRLGPEAWLEILKAAGKEIENTPTASTPSKGTHLYYKRNGLDIGCSAGKLGPGLDVRAVGGYVVAPPSATPQGEYAWEMDLGIHELALLPLHQHIIARLGERGERAEIIPTRIPDGIQHYTLVSLAGTMRRRGMTAGEIEVALWAVNQSRCEKPGPRKNIRQIAQSVGQYAPEAPLGQIVSEAVADIPIKTWDDLANKIGPIEWEWEPWLPKGLLVIVAGAPGVGKSALLLRIAACFIRGDPWPTGLEYGGKCGEILWCETESAHAINLSRAKEWGLPLDQIVTPLEDELADLRLDDEEHMNFILSRAYRPQLRAIFVDSLRGGHRLDENSSLMIEIVTSLASIAKVTGKPVIVSHHLRKRGMLDSAEITLDRLRGSSALIQPARVIWALDKPDPLVPDKIRIAVIKNNIAAFPEPVGFSVNGEGISFGDAPEKPRQETARDRAANFLLVFLKSEPRKISEIREESEIAGLSWDAMRKAKRALGVTHHKGDKYWWWSLSSRDTPDNKMDF